jgi:hypothetical protein
MEVGLKKRCSPPQAPNLLYGGLRPIGRMAVMEYDIRSLTRELNCNLAAYPCACTGYQRSIVK